jgi:hypothetical protein
MALGHIRIFSIAEGCIVAEATAHAGQDHP